MNDYYNIPKNNTEYLIETYGKDWKIPKMSLHDLRLYIEDECRRIN